MKTFPNLFFLAISLASISVNACTGIKLPSGGDNYVNGRTVEFDVTIDLSPTFIPRGHEFTAELSGGQKGMNYKSKYAALGMICFGYPALMDGMNEKGLSVGVFYFPEYADYAKVDSSNRHMALSPIDFSNWLLTQFAGIEEVKESLDQVIIAPTVFKAWGSEPPPFHYIVYDQKGNALVIEPLEGRLVTYDNPFGTFTNSPTFDWHMTNLRNYINLRTMNSPPMIVEGVTLSPFGMGSGMQGLPGDFTPPSRFVRAFIFSETAVKAQGSTDAVLQAFHILNQFDIPKGSSRVKFGKVVYDEYTMMTTVKDPETLVYYYRTYDDQSIRMLDLKKFDPNDKSLKIGSSHGTQVIFDMTKALKKS